MKSATLHKAAAFFGLNIQQFVESTAEAVVFSKLAVQYLVPGEHKVLRRLQIAHGLSYSSLLFVVFFLYLLVVSSLIFLTSVYITQSQTAK